jgi:hypothetical protein
METRVFVLFLIPLTCAYFVALSLRRVGKRVRAQVLDVFMGVSRPVNTLRSDSPSTRMSVMLSVV